MSVQAVDCSRPNLMEGQPDAFLKARRKFKDKTPLVKDSIETEIDNENWRHPVIKDAYLCQGRGRGRDWQVKRKKV